MNIVIVGACGNIGRRLLGVFPEAVGVDRVPGADIVVDLLLDDLGSGAMGAALGRADAVVHLATSADPDAPDSVHYEAIIATARLLDACGTCGVERVVLPSSDWAEPAPGGPPINAYGHSKRAIEAMGALYSSGSGASALAIRYGWVPHSDAALEDAEDWLKANYWSDAVLEDAVRRALGLETRRG